MQTAVITGGTRGFGLALATSLVTDGWSVVIDGRDRSAVDDAVHALRDSAGRWAHPRNRRRRRRSSASGRPPRGRRRDSAVSTCWSTTPAFSGRHHNLDWPTIRSTCSSTSRPSTWSLPWHSSRRCCRCSAACNGTVVDVTSDAAIEGYAGWGGYGSSKAALEQLSNVLAAEEPGIRVLLVRPWRHAHGDASGGLP